MKAYEAASQQLAQSLENFKPFNEQEAIDKQNFLLFLKTQNNIWTRENPIAHLTASAWIVNTQHDKVLMIYHNIYQSWAWTGGHADGETNLLRLAIREAQEETGLVSVKAASDAIFGIEILPVEGHVKKGVFVSPHLHYNITYLLLAEDTHAIRHNPEENSKVKWFPLDEAVKVSTEPYMKTIYAKLNAKSVDSLKSTCYTK